MDLSAIASDMETSQLEALYAVKLFKMAQNSEFAVTSELLEDVAEISKEAMDMFMSERV